jgi:biotin transport system substrate-specific component
MIDIYYAKPLILSSLFAAVTGICSILSIPLPFSPVPVNLALLSVYLAGGLLGPRYGPLSQLIYLLLGAVGLPVFHNLTGGLTILAGPTGGFIIGYIAASFIVGLFYSKHKSTPLLTVGLLLGLTACYTLGTLWFMYITGTDSLIGALLLCVIPFLPGDALKILGAIFLIKKLRPFIDRSA